jgi:hypothetical protein
MSVAKDGKYIFQKPRRTSTTSTLYHAQNEQSCPAALYGQANVCATVHCHGQQVYDSSTGHVGHVADDGGSNAGDDQVGGDGEINLLDGDMQGLG